VEHVVRQPSPPFLALGGALQVHQLPAAHDNLVWLLVCTTTGEAALVDGPDTTALDAATALGARVGTILITHTHGDHVGILHQLARQGRLDRFRVVGPGVVADAIPGLTEPVDDGSVVRLGKVEGRVLRTDGHLDGHVSYVFGDDDGVLCCGDTLFTGGCGYLFSGPPSAMFDSLLRLAALPGGTRVCCAHEYTQDNLRFAWTVEPDNTALADRIRRVWAIRAEGGSAVPSTIEEERATNPFLRPGSPSLVRHVRAAMPDSPLDRPVDVFTATRALKDRGLWRAHPDPQEPPLAP
jgi:hydroxyacylglutathione hydrolase